MFEPRDTTSLSLEERVQLLLDERAIRDVICRDCRAKSRRDAQLMRTCFFEDALDHHQPMFDWPFSRLADVIEQGAMGPMIQYVATQILIDLQGDVARTETYVLSTKIFNERADNGDKIIRQSGMRMLDRFERRGGEWRIAERWFVPEWGFFKQVSPLKAAIGPYGVGTDADQIVCDPSLETNWHKQDRTDPSYRF